MCVIIHRPAGVVIPEARLKTCMANNSDGWGIMWAENGRVHVRKGRKMKDFHAAYAEAGPDREVGIHFRWKTHGRIDDANAHPYAVLEKERHGVDVWLMHNGVIDVREVDPAMSDTWHWINFLIRPMVEHGLFEYGDDDFWQFVAEDSTGSRLLFLDGDGKFTRTGTWHERDGAHYSNAYNFSTAGTAGRYGGWAWEDYDYCDFPGETAGRGFRPFWPANAGGRYYEQGGELVALTDEHEAGLAENEYDGEDLGDVKFDPWDAPDELDLDFVMRLSYRELILLAKERPDDVADFLWRVMHEIR